jgi:hypothetical protein
MKRSDRGPVALLMAASALLGAAMYFSAPANADDDSVVYAYAATFGGIVCSTLDQYPTFDGIIGIGQAMIEDGLTGYQAGQVIATSAIEICPRHIALVRNFANSYSGATV